MPPTLCLITDRLSDPVLDNALSGALLHRVALGEAGPTLRLYTPGRIVAFGSQDRVRPGYAAAMEAAETLGFSAIERLVGGRAAACHEGTIALTWSTPDPDPKSNSEERFNALSSIVIDALARLDITGAVGELPGEYCPGRFSVHVKGHKVMGIGQRVVRNAAHVGGVLSLHSPELINRALVPTYEALGYDWSPSVTGAIGRSTDEAIPALTAAFGAAGYSVCTSSIEPEMLASAGDFADDPRRPIL